MPDYMVGITNTDMLESSLRLEGSKNMFRSLRIRVIATCILVVLLAQTITSMVIGLQARDATEQRVGVLLVEQCRYLINSLDKSMWTWSNQVEVLSNVITLTGGTTPKVASAMLHALRDAVPDYSWIGLTNAEGTVIASTDDLLLGKSIAKRPVFIEGLKGNFVGDVHEAVLLANLLPNPTGEQMKFVDTSSPVRDKNGNTTGVLGAHLSWTWAREVEKNMLQKAATGKGVELFVVAADGTVLLGNPELLGKPLALPLLEDIKNRSAGWAIQSWPDGHQYLTGVVYGTGYDDYPGMGWTAVARQPLEIAYAPVTRLMTRMAIAGFVLSIVFALVGWLVAEKVIAPIRDLTRAATDLSSGIPTEFPRNHPIREVEVLSNSIATLVENLTKSEFDRDRIQNAAIKDPLTGLFNRMGLAAYLESVLPRIANEGHTLEVFYMDLDGFKQVNDTLGHQAGDAVLVTAAERLAGCLRKDDVLVRLGGDEFLALMASSQEGVHSIDLTAERINKSIGAPMHVEGQEVSVGVSIGHATWRGGDPWLEEALARADSALYAAKKAGKNRMVTSS